MSDTKDTSKDPAGTAQATETKGKAAQADAPKTHTPTKAQREYLASGTAPAADIKPTTFDGEQPPGGHPQDPTSKGSVGSKREL